MKVESIYRVIGARIATVRKVLALTQADLARRAGISRPSLANIERGRQRILLHQIVIFAKAFGSTPSALMKGVWR